MLLWISDLFVAVLQFNLKILLAFHTLIHSPNTNFLKPSFSHSLQWLQPIPGCFKVRDLQPLCIHHTFTVAFWCCESWNGFYWQLSAQILELNESHNDLRFSLPSSVCYGLSLLFPNQTNLQSSLSRLILRQIPWANLHKGWSLEFQSFEVLSQVW